MSSDRLRRRVAREAARLLYDREEAEYHRAKRKAARRVLGPSPSWAGIPSKREISEQMQALARSEEACRRQRQICAMRAEALRLMQALREYQPRLIGPLVAGDLPPDGSIELQVFAATLAEVAAALEQQGWSFHKEPADKPGLDSRLLLGRLILHGGFPCQLLCFPPECVYQPLTNPITNRPTERLTITELEALLAGQGGHGDDPRPTNVGPCHADRFYVYQMLLAPLEEIHENLAAHPEGDLLYHSLQVFELARQHRPYDEELLLAALLHDVGKAIDPKQHESAAIEALAGWITPRTAWLIEQHTAALALRAGKLGARARRRLEECEDYEELMLLAECDQAGRQPGVATPDLSEALAYIRQLSQACDEGE